MCEKWYDYMQPGWCQPVRQEFMENECEALPGVAYPGVRDNLSTINTKTGYDEYDESTLQSIGYIGRTRNMVLQLTTWYSGSLIKLKILKSLNQYLVLHFNFLFVPCGGLSWLPVSFLLHVKYTLSYRIVSYKKSNQTGKADYIFRLLWSLNDLNIWICLFFHRPHRGDMIEVFKILHNIYDVESTEGLLQLLN